YLATYRDKEVQLWDVDSQRPHGAPLPHDDPVSQVEFSPDGAALLTLQRTDPSGGPLEYETRIWNVATAQALNLSMKTSPRGDLPALFSPDSTRLLLYENPGPYQQGQGQARLWDPGTGLPIAAGFSISGFPAFSPDSQWLFALTPSLAAQLRDAKTGQLIDR